MSGQTANPDTHSPDPEDDEYDGALIEKHDEKLERRRRIRNPYIDDAAMDEDDGEEDEDDEEEEEEEDGEEEEDEEEEDEEEGREGTEGVERSEEEEEDET